MNIIVAKELLLSGTFRFDPEFAQAVELVGTEMIDVKPLITATLRCAEVVEANELASHRSQSMKVHLAV